MKYQSNHHNTYIWTPLIGFDKNEIDKGVAAYYDNIGFNPDGISLFVISPDIVHHHEGMGQERILPPDNCNYLGNLRNEMREIQEWSNYDLQKLVQGLEERGASTFMGIMGIFTNLEQNTSNQYNVGHREWLFDHKELMEVRTNGLGGLNVLKRFKDGTYYEDFFLEKVRQALKDYGFSGLHAADKFCPPDPAGSARNGDFSDDMIDQFMMHTGIKLPEEIRFSIDDQDRESIKKRGTYIWNRYKLEWLKFLGWRWGQFWTKICNGLHEDNKTVMVNNAWCSEPFEAIYRYGIDYQQLYKAGVDWLVAETVPTGAHSVRPEKEPYRLYNYMTMPAFIKAYSPEGKLLCLNGVKDSTEEWSNITYYPSHVEREIYSLGHYFLKTSEGLERVTNGLMVCLGDGLTEDEWAWLRERWNAGFAEIPEKVLAPTLIWSDNALTQFLPDYIKTKRWSTHKTVYELAKTGGQVAVIARIENLDHVNGAIFIPNIDLLSQEEIEIIAAYNRGPIICTSLVERNFEIPGLFEPDIYFTDTVAEYKMCLLAYGLDYIDYDLITASLGEDDGTPDIKGEPRYVEDPLTWCDDLVFRKVSSGFIRSCSQLIRSCTPCDMKTSIQNPILPMVLKDGRLRLLLANDNRIQYKSPIIASKKIIKKISNKSKFPALPALLLDTDHKPIVPKSNESHKNFNPYGFIAKIPPGGMSIMDIELES